MPAKWSSTFRWRGVIPRPLSEQSWPSLSTPSTRLLQVRVSPSRQPWRPVATWEPVCKMDRPELDPDHLDTLETWDTGLPRVLCPRDGLAGGRQAPRAEATIVVCLAEDGSLSEYALLT